MIVIDEKGLHIPQRFTLLGQTITVVYQNDLYFKQDRFGEAVYRKNEIVLQSPSAEVPITKEQVEQHFFHELVHFLFAFGGEDGFDPPLHEQEYLVDRIAGLLQQALKTSEYGGPI